MAKGEAGFFNATVSITTGGAYVGGGIAGYIGGVTSTFNVKMRKPKITRPRQTTTDGAYQTGVGGPVSSKLSLEGYFKGTNYPPVNLSNEFIKVSIVAIFTLSAVVLVEDFTCTGDVDSAVQFSLEGETDDTFTFN